MLLALCVSLILTADEPAYRTDGRLAAEVTLAINTRPVGEIVQELSKHTDARMTVSTDIAELKMTVFCRNRPLNEVMQKIEEAMFFEWVESDDGYRLTYPRAIASEELNLLNLESRLRREQVELRIMNAIDDSRRDLSELRTELELLSAQRSDFAPGDPRADEIDKDVSRLSIYRRGRDMYDLGAILSQLPPSAPEEFLAGRTIMGSTTAQPGVPRLTFDSESGRVMVNSMAGGPQEADGSHLFARYDDDRGLETNRVFTFPDPISITSTSGGYNFGMDRSKLADHAFLRRIGDWTTPPHAFESEHETVDFVSSPIRPGSDSIPCPYKSGFIGAGEQFEDLFNRGEVNIVSDAFRYPISLPKPVDGRTVFEWILGFRAIDSGPLPLEKGYIRVSGNWMMYRHPSFWRLKPQEVPERVFAPMEARARVSMPTLEEYSRFVSQITYRQAARFDWPGVLARFDPLPVASAHPALRFYASLSPQQRDAASRSTGLDERMLNPVQNRLYWEAVESRIWVGPRGARGAFIFGLPENAEMRFFVTAESAISIHEPGNAQSAVSFEFGAGRSGSVSYSVHVHLR